MEDVSVLIANSQAGDKKARELLIEKNLGLVKHIALRFAGRGVEGEDLFQIGTIGLIRAIDRFDLSLGLQFSTYAVPMIMGEIRRFLRDDGPVKISRQIRENRKRLFACLEELTSLAGCSPGLNEIAQKAGLSRADALLALEAPDTTLPLESGTEYEDGTSHSLMDVLTGGENGVVQTTGTFCRGDPEKDRLIDHMTIVSMLDELSKEDRLLIVLRYYRNQTQMQVSDIMGISQVQVSRREKKILTQMREKLL